MAPRQPAWAAPDHPRLAVDEQYRGAIGVQDAKPDAGRRRHHGIDLRRFAPRPDLIDHGHARAVGLPGGDEAGGIEIASAHHPGAVLRHPLAVVPGTEAAIERGVDALADAAGPPEEAVADSADGAKILRLDHVSSAKPGELTGWVPSAPPP